MPAPAPRLRRCLSFRPRHLEATKQPSDVDPTVRHAAVGIGLAMRALLNHYRELGTRPMVLNERTVPLHDASTAAASFVWTDEIDGLGVPHLHACVDLVLSLAAALELRTEDLVTAFMLWEQAIRRNPAIVRTYTMRPVLLGCCTVALKVLNDKIVTLTMIRDAVEPLFPALTDPHLKWIEFKLLETMNWTIPMGPICQTYADELFSLADLHTGTVVKAPAVLLAEVKCL